MSPNKLFAPPVWPVAPASDPHADAQRLREHSQSTVTRIARSENTIERTYMSLANVGAYYATARIGANQLSDALAPSVARAYMVARRRSGLAAAEPTED